MMTNKNKGQADVALEELEKEDEIQKDTVQSLLDEEVEELESGLEEVDETPQATTEDLQEEDEVEEEEEETPEEDTTPTPPIETQPSPDYKEKFSNSTRESQVLSAQIQKNNEAIEKAEQITDVSDEDLANYARADGLNVDEMSPTEKTLYKRGVISDLKLAEITKATKEGKQIQEFANKVDSFIDDETNLNEIPELRTKSREFKEFALKPTRRGLDPKDLWAIFSFEASKNPQTKHKGSLLTTKTTNREGAPKPRQLNEKDSSRIRKTNPQLYKRLLKSGKLDIKI